MEIQLPMNLNSKGNALTVKVREGWRQASLSGWDSSRSLSWSYIRSSQESHIMDYGTSQTLPFVKLPSRKSAQNTESKTQKLIHEPQFPQRQEAWLSHLCSQEEPESKLFLRTIWWTGRYSHLYEHTLGCRGSESWLPKYLKFLWWRNGVKYFLAFRHWECWNNFIWQPLYYAAYWTNVFRNCLLSISVSWDPATMV